MSDQPDSATEIVERIMSQHWDIASCPCWICVAGRGIGCRPREAYLMHQGDNRERFARVDVVRDEEQP